MHLRFFGFFGFIVSQFSFRLQRKRKNLKKINLKNSGEKSVEAGNSKAKMLFSFMQKAAHCQKPNFLNGVESIFMFQRDHTQNRQYFWGEGGETSAKQRFLTQLFLAKSRAEISPDGENRVGRRSEQRRLQSPEGAGPPKMPAFLGRRRNDGTYEKSPA